MKRTDVALAVGMLATVLLAWVALAATGSLDGFLSWAWERHHNVLSWYIRPLFILPLIYFSYRLSLSGIVLTLVALMSSIFWFPAPEQADPMVEEFLAFEREWLTGEWPLAKVLMTSLAPPEPGRALSDFLEAVARVGSSHHQRHGDREGAVGRSLR